MPEDGCSIVRIECLVSEVGDQGHLVRRENTMGGYSGLEGPSTDRAYPNMIEEVRFAPDSALEGDGFELSVPGQRRHPSATANHLFSHHLPPKLG